MTLMNDAKLYGQNENESYHIARSKILTVQHPKSRIRIHKFNDQEGEEKHKKRIRESLTNDLVGNRGKMAENDINGKRRPKI